MVAANKKAFSPTNGTEGKFRGTTRISRCLSRHSTSFSRGWTVWA